MIRLQYVQIILFYPLQLPGTANLIIRHAQQFLNTFLFLVWDTEILDLHLEMLQTLSLAVNDENQNRVSTYSTLEFSYFRHCFRTKLILEIIRDVTSYLLVLDTAQRY